MLRIGDFARLAGVTVRALRHYEAEGLLAPARVDEGTGYRSYRFDQLADIDRILALRDLGFTLADVRFLLASRADVRALSARLRLQHARLAAEVARQTTRLRRIEALRRAISADASAAAMGARVRPLPDVSALTLRARIRSPGAPIAPLFEEAEARAAEDRAYASPFLVLHARRDVEVCIPVRPGCPAAGVRTIAGAPLAGSITYSGGYGQTPALPGRLVRWLERSG